MKLTALAALALISVTAAGCVTASQNKDNLLAAAGFKVRLADTPAKVASLKSLPPHKFVLQQGPYGQPRFLYADPTVCGCIYYGGQSNFEAYQQMAYTQRLANEQEMTAMMNQQAAFDYGPWGSPFFY